MNHKVLSAHIATRLSDDELRARFIDFLQTVEEDEAIDFDIEDDDSEENV